MKMSAETGHGNTSSKQLRLHGHLSSRPREEANPDRLIRRNAFNISAMSLAPEDIAAAIREEIPDFQLSFEVDPIRQAIADSWPNAMDDSCARWEWDWSPDYDLESMTLDMLTQLRKCLA